MKNHLFFLQFALLLCIGLTGCSPTSDSQSNEWEPGTSKYVECDETYYFVRQLLDDGSHYTLSTGPSGTSIIILDPNSGTGKGFYVPHGYITDGDGEIDIREFDVPPDTKEPSELIKQASPEG